MAHNLFVAYDLMAPGQHYPRVQHAIKLLGRWYQVQRSLFYVYTPLDAGAAHTKVWAAMDGNDKLTVLDVTRAVIHPIDPADLAAINKLWFS